ncbi:MAG: menaquinone biosynthetic enzyme MqnA/MqnD family protein [Nitrospirota bacterium]
MQNKLKIGEIRYANCTPLYSMLKEHSDCSGFEFIPGEPAKLNMLLAMGGIDISSSSSIEYARHWREYLAVPGVSISSRGRVGSILLFSRKPIEELSGAFVSVSSASATSVVLLKALFRFMFKIEARLVPHRPVLHEMLEGRQAALIIGDEALKENMALDNSLGLMVYDLGTLWQDFTGLPFVYALWMVRRDSSERLPGLATRFKSGIISAREAAASRYEEIASNAPESAWMGVPGLVDYWETMSYDLTDEHIAGLMKFYGYAMELEEVPDSPVLRFL